MDIWARSQDGGLKSRKSVTSRHTDLCACVKSESAPGGLDYRIQILKYTLMGDCRKVDNAEFLADPFMIKCFKAGRHLVSVEYCNCFVKFSSSYLCLPLYIWNEGALLSVLPVAWIFNSLCVLSLYCVYAYIISTKSLKINFCKRFFKARHVIESQCWVSYCRISPKILVGICQMVVFYKWAWIQLTSPRDFISAWSEFPVLTNWCLLGIKKNLWPFLKEDFLCFRSGTDTHSLELGAGTSVLGGSCKVLSTWLTLREYMLKISGTADV